MRNTLFHTIALTLLLSCTVSVFAQLPIGIGTTTPDSHAALDITSATKGVLFPRLTTAQQTTLAGMLTTAEKGMMIMDATTGAVISWTGSAWSPGATSTPLTAAGPLAVTTNNLALNPGTAAGDLLTWDGINWVNRQPAVQHFSITVDNHQPYLALNYVIALAGIFPSQSDATEPYLGEIYLMGCNFAPNGFAFCNGQLLPITQNAALFDLLGTFYGGDGVTTFALPNLQSRVPIHQGQGPGLSNFVIGETGGTENMIFTR